MCCQVGCAGIVQRQGALAFRRQIWAGNLETRQLRLALRIRPFDGRPIDCQLGNR